MRKKKNYTWLLHISAEVRHFGKGGGVEGEEAMACVGVRLSKVPFKRRARQRSAIKRRGFHNILTFSVISDGHPPQHDD